MGPTKPTKPTKKALGSPPSPTPSSTPWWPYPRPTGPTMAYTHNYKQLGNYPNGMPSEPTKSCKARTMFFCGFNLDLLAVYIGLQVAIHGKTTLHGECVKAMIANQFGTWSLWKTSIGLQFCPNPTKFWALVENQIHWCWLKFHIHLKKLHTLCESKTLKFWSFWSTHGFRG